VNKVLEVIKEDDFQEPSLMNIFLGIASVARREETVSPISISEELENMGLLEKSGGVKELYALRHEGQEFLKDAPVTFYARMLKKYSARQKVKTIIAESNEVLKEDSGVPVKEVLSDLMSNLNAELYGLSESGTSTELSESLKEYSKLLEERKKLAEENAEFSDGLQGIPSSIPSLNKYTTGWLAGQLITIGARTGVGKSVFAVNSAVAAAQANKSVLFISLEMSEEEIQDRIVASVSGIPMNKLKQGNISEEEKPILKSAVESMERYKILIDTEPKVTIDSIRAKALKRATSPEGLDFIIVDYLQLITPSSSTTNRQVQVAELSRNMKILAKQLSIPIMTLVQVNREKDDDEDSIPKLYQIRESGAIAQDSDIVILLHREPANDDSIPKTLIILAKNRNGQPDKIINCYSNLECSNFREVTRSKDIERMTDEESEELMDDSDLDIDFDEGFDDDDDSLDLD
jgi:replicative DNA helicase